MLAVQSSVANRHSAPPAGAGGERASVAAGALQMSRAAVTALSVYVTPKTSVRSIRRVRAHQKFNVK